MEGELKACPFCGGRAMLMDEESEGVAGVCVNCGACGKNSPSDAEAIAAWNTRALPASAIHAARVEGAEAATKRALQAVEDEPNLPGPMPDGFQKTFEQLPLAEALRIIVALTKSEIRERIVATLEQKKESHS